MNISPSPSLSGWTHPPQVIKNLRQYHRGRDRFLYKPYQSVRGYLHTTRYIITNTDQDPSPQPDWATEGSFLVFRKLQQLVPEFNK